MKKGLLSIVLLVAILTGFLVPAATPVAFAAFHGATIQKSVVGPDGVNAFARVGDTVTATIRVTNADTFGDAITVQTITDTVNHTSGNVTSGNLLPGGTPVVLSNLGNFVEVTHTYVVATNDSGTITDLAESTGTDSGLILPWNISFPGQLQIVAPAITIEKQVSVDGGTTWLDADTPPGPSIAVPGTVKYRVIVTNTGNVPLTNVAVTDNTTLVFSGVATSLAVGASSTSNITSTAALVGLHSDTATVNALFGTIPVTASDAANYTGLAAPTVFPTRTLGFWQNHTAFTTSIFAQFFPAGMKIGVAPHKGTITNIQQTGKSQLFGAFFASIPMTTSKDKRSDLDKARIQMLQQLVAAKLNAAAFGASASTLTLISNADAAYAGTNVALILDLTGQLDIYNNSGDNLPLPSGLPDQGRATPQTSRDIADLAFWDTP